MLLTYIKLCAFIHIVVYAYIVNTNITKGPSWSWSYGSYIYNYLCNQFLSPLKLWVRTPLSRGVLDTTLCNKACQLLATGRWFSPGTPFPPPIKLTAMIFLKTKPKITMQKHQQYNIIYKKQEPPTFWGTWFHPRFLVGFGLLNP